jgi:hypothetical protein
MMSTIFPNADARHTILTQGYCSLVLSTDLRKYSASLEGTIVDAGIDLEDLPVPGIDTQRILDDQSHDLGSGLLLSIVERGNEFCIGEAQERNKVRVIQIRDPLALEPSERVKFDASTEVCNVSSASVSRIGGQGGSLQHEIKRCLRAAEVVKLLQKRKGNIHWNVPSRSEAQAALKQLPSCHTTQELNLTHRTTRVKPKYRDIPI